VSNTAAPAGGAATIGGGANAIPVGLYGYKTGETANFGISCEKGVTLAVEEVNKAGGVLGRPLSVVSLDDGGKADAARTDVIKLIDESKVVAVLGEVASTRSKAGAPYCQQKKIPMITPASTNVEVTQIGDYIFRVCYTDDVQGSVMANFAVDDLKLKSAAVMEDLASDYSKGLSAEFQKAFKAKGGSIVGVSSYASSDLDYKAQLSDLLGKKPEVLFVPGYYGQVGTIARQARELGFKGPLLGGDGWVSDKLIPSAGNALEGCYFANHYSEEDKDPTVQSFISAFKGRFNNETPDAMAALGYDAAKVLADAIKRAGATDAAKLRDAIAATHAFKGVTGVITINAARNAVKPITVIAIKNGGFHFAKRVSG
jgi:branched-chain amino acid transport system substrate-binding protein